MMVDRAGVWDFDGTLVDTRRKNWQVTRALIPAVSGRPPEAFPALASLEAIEGARRINPAILIPVDASPRFPRQRIYPLTLQAPLAELDLLSQ
ncbi:MAG: hypothetical protein ACK2UH_09940, partial [Candidatus Promineifilaceae bacterium]